MAPSAPSYPTAAHYLTSAASTGFAATLGNSIVLAQRRRLRLRLTELGTASCSGHAGATDTFAVALWAPDALFSLLAAGVDGVNIHNRYNEPSSALVGGSYPADSGRGASSPPQSRRSPPALT